MFFRRFMVMLAAAALLAACSDDDGNKGVDLGGKDGMATDQKLGDRGSVDRKLGDRGSVDRTTKDQAPVKDKMTPDMPWSRDMGGVFACGAKARCTVGSYCESMLPGICGGSPVPDSGVCPPNCIPTTCKNTRVCLCTSYQCKTMPSGCADCTCLKKALGPACSCTTQSGGIYVRCAAP